MSRFVRIEVNVETLVDELYAYVTDPPAVRRNREYAVLRELGGPVKSAVRRNWEHLVRRDWSTLKGPGTLGLNPEVLEVMRLDGVQRREDVAAYVSWSLTTCMTAAPRAKRRLPVGRLTRREAEVLRLVAEGLTDPQVAERLYLSPRTVGQHLRSIYNKLGVSTRLAATRFALEHGLT